MASNTSIIEYLPMKIPKYVRKTLKPEKRKYVNLVAKEVEALKRLRGSGRAPELVKFGKDWILMTYVGKRVRSNNLPKDWRAQVKDILRILREASISHNDIQWEEILVRKGRLYLIDFQHWTNTREEFEELVRTGRTTCDYRLGDKESLMKWLGRL
jgi:predicted Ser/Thr protein kinase